VRYAVDRKYENRDLFSLRINHAVTDWFDKLYTASGTVETWSWKMYYACSGLPIYLKSRNLFNQLGDSINILPGSCLFPVFIPVVPRSIWQVILVVAPYL